MSNSFVDSDGFVLTTHQY